jgi:dipicolinate synthase subunit B
LAKLANAITDSAVLMATKAHLRNHKPVVISISTNDALGLNAKNIGLLEAAKNIYFIPYTQDNYQSKPNSLIADVELLIPTIIEARNGKQIEPILITQHK